MGRNTHAEGITTIEAANQYLRDVYCPAFNAEFARAAAEPGSAFVPLMGVKLDDVLCDHLQGEHPQTVAVLLSHLAPKRAADILTQLPPRMQTDVVGRLIDLDEADPAVVEEIERQLDEMLSDRMARERRRAAGVAAVSSILAAADQQSRRQLIASLTQHDQQLAGRLGRSTLSAADSHSVARPIDALPTQAAEPFRPPAKSRVLAAESPDSPARKSVRGRSRSVELSELERSPEMSQTDAPSRAEPNMDRETAPTGPAPDFHSLTGLSNPALARVLMSVDPHLAILALAGASRELVERVMRQLPTRDARSLRRRIEEIGPVRLGDVEEAQRRVAEEAQRAGFLSSAPVDSAPSLSAIV